MLIVILLIIIFCAYNSFHLLPFYHIKGVFNISDVGLIFIIITALWIFISHNRTIVIRRLKNPFSLLILIYLLYVAIQVATVMILYDQTMLDGFIRARHQGYYLIFVIFLAAFNDVNTIRKFMTLLGAISLILIAIGVVNYLGISIVHHKWAEGHGIRTGIKRAFFPGMGIIVAVGIWNLLRYLDKREKTLSALLMFLTSCFGIVFRQTRMTLIAMTVTVLIVLIMRGRAMVALGVCVIMSMAVVFAGLTMEENIIIDPFKTAFEDVRDGDGSWVGRMQQIEADWKVISEYPIFGNGGLVLRGSDQTKLNSAWGFAGFSADLGYMHWLKFFGLFGLIWLLCFIILFFQMAWKNIRTTGSDKLVVNGALYIFLYIVIAEITLDSFMQPIGIILVCLTLAFLICSKDRLKNDIL